MKTVTVELADRSYPIHLENGLLDKLPEILDKQNGTSSWIIISQPSILELLGPRLKARSLDSYEIIVSEGESAKDLDEYRSVISKMIEIGCDRSSTILALGGGVVGDLAGFVAATYMRGIDFIQIPTTFLGMVDSAIGGKTGINLPEGKNMVGAFHQPKAVLIDPTILESLPREEAISGLAEVIKYGAIQDRDFLIWVLSELDEIKTFDFESAITRCCAIKADVVSQDEREGGLRRILNFGHTIGHAIEAHMGYGDVRHGEAVAYGMNCAAWISEQLGILPAADRRILNDTIAKLSLAAPSSLDQNAILNYIHKDKKGEDGVLNFVVLEGLGNATTSTKVQDQLIIESLAYLL
ncbi:MAG: 3-dehydroquinate synthase [Candidatus Marinimicrobia bacterium]|nr:3-dehydroquinate synthase [Candidatus Neomarinimicrobiota bacterium]MDP6965881.1 3-dehydroquinate synthase [Candidatus Neomarinimicrobiota bacterium]